MKTFKLKGIEYYAIDCKNSFHALTTFLYNKCGVTLENIVEFNENIPHGAIIFKGI